MARVLGLLYNVDGPVLRELPHRLSVAGREGWGHTLQPLIPFPRLSLAADWDSREQVELRVGEHADNTSSSF
jgi:hypothetical protein